MPVMGKENVSTFISCFFKPRSSPLTRQKFAKNLGVGPLPDKVDNLLNVARRLSSVFSTTKNGSIKEIRTWMGGGSRVSSLRDTRRSKNREWKNRDWKKKRERKGVKRMRVRRGKTEGN